MKKIMLLVGLVIIFATAFYLYTKPASEKYVAENASVQVEEKVILLYPESGDVTFRVSESAMPQVATASPTVIPNNAIVHTGVGKASVLLPDNSSFSLDENTEITINYNDNKTSLYQSFGTTYHRVQKLLTGASYQVQTAGTLAAVRGTKFVVKYDVKSKKTKIAVTESKVEVSTVTKSSGVTSAPYSEEHIMVEVGKMVNVDTRTQASAQNQKASAMQMTDTTNDTEMKAIVDREKKGDIDLNTIKKDVEKRGLGKPEIRREIKRIMFNDTSVVEIKPTASKTQDTTSVSPVVKVEIKESVVSNVRDTAVTAPAETVSKPPLEVITRSSVTTVSDEEFFTAFEALFIKYFYLDDTDTPCSVRTASGERVKIVTDFALSKQRSFTKETLPAFADAIDAYCVRKDAAVKVKLQARFDDEYPF